jgi:phospholipase C
MCSGTAPWPRSIPPHLNVGDEILCLKAATAAAIELRSLDNQHVVRNTRSAFEIRPGQPIEFAINPAAILRIPRRGRIKKPAVITSYRATEQSGGYMRRREFLKLTAGSAAATIAPGNLAVAQAALSKINHFVVLMLENRSFDNLLGRLYPKSATFDGLSGDEFNLDPAGKPIHVNNLPGMAADVLTIPDPNPGERWTDINEQLFGVIDPPQGAIPQMNGFVLNYLKQTKWPAERYDPKRIMHCFTPEQVPVLSQLARQFAVSDRWFASAPTQTWPNRFFVHAGTANGYENNAPPHFPYMMPTIFDRLKDMDPVNGWRIYFHDVAQSSALSRLWRIRHHFTRFSKFQSDAEEARLPAYTFIEPDYLSFLGPQNDQHPPTSVAAGERLIAAVYNALRQSPLWTSSLLIIVFDEHGGCFDHVPPPAAVPPSLRASNPFNFERYGVRVPALLVSPYIRQGLVLRPPGDTPFDHTSVIATLRKRFDLGGPLSERDAVAPTVESVLTLPDPTNMGPERIDAPLLQPRVASPEAASDPARVTDLQASLAELARVLPDPGEEEAHIRRLEASPERAAPPRLSPREAGAIVDRNIRRFLGES